jgi:hypothetical protein
MEIKVKTITGMKYAVDIDDTSTIADIKSVILTKTGIPAQQQRYIYCGKLLSDEQIVMNLPEAKACHNTERHLTEGMTLNMILSLRGG